MSTEIFILSDTQLKSIVEWQDAIDDQRFSLRLSGGPIDESGGSFTGKLNNKQTSLEYRNEDFDALRGFYNNVKFNHDWKYVIALPWIVGLDGLVATWMAAVAYALATKGAVFDPQEGRIFSGAEALKVVREIEQAKLEADVTR